MSAASEMNNWNEAQEPTHVQEKEMAAKFMAPTFLKEFIEIYRNSPCLWKIDSKEYHNRRKKEAAWAQLLSFTQQKIPNATPNFLKKRLESLRACVRRELRKVQASKTSGATADDIYQPKLWYYEMFEFIAVNDTVRGSKYHFSPPEDYGFDSEMDVSQPLEEEGDDEEEDNKHNILDVLLEETDITTPAPTPTCGTKRKISETPAPKKVLAAELPSESPAPRESFVTAPAVSAGEQDRREDDECDAVGKLVAAKLKRMKELQRIHAEKLIHDVLYKGLLEQLDESTSVLDIKQCH